MGLLGAFNARSWSKDRASRRANGVFPFLKLPIVLALVNQTVCCWVED